MEALSWNVAAMATGSFKSLARPSPQLSMPVSGYSAVTWWSSGGSHSMRAAVPAEKMARTPVLSWNLPEVWRPRPNLPPCTALSERDWAQIVRTRDPKVSGSVRFIFQKLKYQDDELQDSTIDGSELAYLRDFLKTSIRGEGNAQVEMEIFYIEYQNAALFIFGIDLGSLPPWSSKWGPFPSLRSSLYRSSPGLSDLDLFMVNRPYFIQIQGNMRRSRSEFFEPETCMADRAHMINRAQPISDLVAHPLIWDMQKPKSKISASDPSITRVGTPARDFQVFFPCILNACVARGDQAKCREEVSPFPSHGSKESWICLNQAAGARSEPDMLEESLAFQIQVTLSGKTTMQWARATDLVQDLVQNLESRLGIPSHYLRLLYKGKQLMNTLPLSYYSIRRDASIVVSFRLRGGSFRQTSSAPSFSYKDVVHKDAAHSQPSPSAGHPSEAPKPFLVDKSEDIPSINLSHPGIDDRYQLYAEAALVCRFNGLWPRTSDLYQWIHTNWTKKSEIHLCSKGFFIVVFDRDEDYQKALTGGPWFWGSAWLFLTPWFPDFDPSTAVITKTPIWVRLPNLPVHLWHVSVFLAIAETLGRYLSVDSSRKENGLYTYGRFCAEIDISRGLPDQINLKYGDFHWTQTLDYENTAFRCRHCHQTGHLQSSCPQYLDKKKTPKRKPKSKSWNPCAPPPPMDDSDSTSSDEEEIVADGLNDEIPLDAPLDDPANPSVSQISQKRAHLTSSSDSEKDFPPPGQNSLQLVSPQPNSTEWVKVSKKKGKKSRVTVTIPSG